MNWHEYENMVVEIDYINHTGERRKRKIEIIENSLYFGTTQWHPEPQFLFKACDCELLSFVPTIKDFAMAGVKGIRILD